MQFPLGEVAFGDALTDFVSGSFDGFPRCGAEQAGESFAEFFLA